MLNGRTTGDPDRGAKLMSNNQGDGGLAQAGWTGGQDVVRRVTAAQRSLQHQAELFTNALLADELAKPPGPQRGFDALCIAARVGRDQTLPLVCCVRVPGSCLGFGSVRTAQVPSLCELSVGHVSVV